MRWYDEHGGRWCRDMSSSWVAEPSLWHRTCYNHLLYHLTCQDFERLLEQAAFCCQRCGKANERLAIDHDHAQGDHAVRGLLCPKCNTHLRFVDAGTKPCDDATARYLAHPFERAFPFQLKPAYSRQGTSS